MRKNNSCAYVLDVVLDLKNSSSIATESLPAAQRPLVSGVYCVPANLSCKKILIFSWAWLWKKNRKLRNPPFILQILVKPGSCAIYIVSGKYTENSRRELKRICMKRFPWIAWNQPGSVNYYGNAGFDFSSLFSEDTLKMKNGTSHGLCCS